MTNKLLTTKEAAVRLGVSAAFLERDRCAGAKIPFAQIGARAIRYRQEDLDEFVASRMRTSTCKKFSGKPEINEQRDAAIGQRRS